MLYLHVGKPKLLNKGFVWGFPIVPLACQWYQLPTNGTIGRASGTAAMQLVQMVLPMVSLVEP